MARLLIEYRNMMQYLSSYIFISVCFVLTSCQNSKHINRIPYNRGDSPLEVALMKYDRAIQMDAYSKLQNMKSHCNELFDYAREINKNVAEAEVTRCNAVDAALVELYAEFYTAVEFDLAEVSAIQAELEAVPEDPPNVLAELESTMAGVEFVLDLCDATVLNAAVEEFAVAGAEFDAVWAEYEAPWAEVDAAWAEYEATWAGYEAALEETEVALLECGAVPYLQRWDINELWWLWAALSS